MTMTLSAFFFDLPLYSPITVDKELEPLLFGVLDKTRSEEFHGYNPLAKFESTFEVITDLLPGGNTFLQSENFGWVKVKCRRTEEVFHYQVHWVPKTKQFTKVGQYPSVADFHISEIKQYKKVLPEEKLREFTRAIGLAANGVGIGSFVYLRRIFEHLVHDALLEAKAKDEVDEVQFGKARMDEKIELLREYLPSFLSENRALYSILSVGIHELDEETCLAHFDVVRVGIEIILDENLAKQKKIEKIEDAKKKLGGIKGSISQK